MSAIHSSRRPRTIPSPSQQTNATMLRCCLIVMFVMASSSTTSAQSTTRASTAPAEAQAINSILQQWQKPANTKQWNTTGDPCSGAALVNTIDIMNPDYNPFIKCDCTYDNNTTCLITEMKVYAIDAIGVLPDNLWNLVYLTNLKLGQNYLSGSISSGVGNLTRLKNLDFGIHAFFGPLPSELGLLADLEGSWIKQLFWPPSIRDGKPKKVEGAVH